MKGRKGYATVYWGKMPINVRPQAFPRHEVEVAVGYAERAFRDVADLVPDFSVLTLGMGPVRETEAVLVLRDEREARVFRRGAPEEDGGSKGSCGRSPCASGPGAGAGRGASTSAMGDRPPIISSS